MDFSKVDWLHVVGIGAAAAILGPVALAATGVGAVLGAAGIAVTAGGLGLGAAAVSATSQAKGASSGEK